MNYSVRFKNFCLPKNCLIFLFSVSNGRNLSFFADKKTYLRRREKSLIIIYLLFFTFLFLFHFLSCTFFKSCLGREKVKKEIAHKGDEIGASSLGEKAFLAEERNKKKNPFVLLPCFVYKSLLLREFFSFFRCFALSQLISYCFLSFLTYKKVLWLGKIPRKTENKRSFIETTRR